MEKWAAGLLKTEFGSNSMMKELGTVALVPDFPTVARCLLSRTVVESPEANRAKAAVTNKAFKLPISRVVLSIRSKILL